MLLRLGYAASWRDVGSCGDFVLYCIQCVSASRGDIWSASKASETESHLVVNPKHDCTCGHRIFHMAPFRESCHK